MARKKRSKRKPAPAELPPPEAPKPQSGARPRPLWTVRSRRNLVRAIFAEHDPVDLAGKLLTEKGDATKAKTYFTLMEYLYGKPAQQFEASGPEGERPFQFVTYAPRPNHPVDPNSQDQINKEACRQSLTSPARAAPTNFGDVTQEDEND